MNTLQQNIKKILVSTFIGVLFFLCIPNTAFMQATYDCGTYGSGAYDQNCTEESGGTAGSDSSSGPLSSTGESIKRYGLYGGAFILASAALLVALRKKKSKK
jgi:LPXTG-motif cell wall-anchored protein